ncbi:4-phosphoerythronate dehydrogenase [Ferrimonas balearica]|uniref:4-phosphoerythronate dehydrogenase n=1 Tax=Ferrimonas balearica TaxID=44012 RepID=UPI001C992A8F|nr:4-phosphoerythronate dehydrogenase [Ferrimonas balearica]MBY5922126.1 4-phosphoerythronate dehydrogenase [Ferrimonas balearica]MBY5994534.1 4-phosphoerythronate dehydrogenase [Ferrimonas balearica]
MLLADENMACLDPLFADLTPICTRPGRAISADQIDPTLLAQVHTLLVRSVTSVNAALIDAMPSLRFVGTATIGTDHLDIPALEARGIHWASAPGCNAEAVGEYLLTALLELAERTGLPLSGRTIGLIGVGNTGGAVYRRLHALGLKVLRCDPPKAAAGEPGEWLSLDGLIAQCDVISCHVPNQPDTFHLLDEARLSALKPGCWLINASRGEVIDSRALIAVKDRRPDLRLVMDVWEGEPEPMPELVVRCDLATAHIAGYSVEGKIRGTQMLHQALAASPVAPEGIATTPELSELLTIPGLGEVTLDGPLDEQRLLSLCRRVYDLAEEDARFREAIGVPGGFDARRKANLARREFSALTVRSRNSGEVAILASLGFDTEE